MGEGVEALLVGAVLAHVTFLTTLAIAHWFRAVGDLMAFLPYAPPALGWFGEINSLVTFLSAVTAA